MTMLLAEPKPKRWTQAEFLQMADLGWFQDQRAELVEGEIVVLSPQSFPHTVATDRVAELLDDFMGTMSWVRLKAPLDLGPASLPEPDVSVVPGRREDYSAHPTSAVLVVEISDTTLAFDRNRKSRLYARAGILDYWIVDLEHACIEVHRDPLPAVGESGTGYASVTTFARGQSLRPLAMPSLCIEIAAILPQPATT